MPTLMLSAHCEGDASAWINYASTIALCLLFINVLWQRFKHPHSHCHSEGHAHTHQPNNNSNIKEVIIKGMNCSHCRANATKALLSIPGITSVDIDLATGRAQISGETSLAAIQEALASLGFSAEEA